MFKKGDRIRRVRDFKEWAPKDFESTMIDDKHYVDKFGSHVLIVIEYWDLIEQESINNNYELY